MKGSTGYPNRSYIADILTPDFDTLLSAFDRRAEPAEAFVAFYLSFFAACIYELHANIVRSEPTGTAPHLTPQAWVERQVSDTDAVFWEPIAVKHKRIFAHCVAAKTDCSYVVASSILQHACGQLNACEMLSKCLPVLFIFDEANSFIQKIRNDSDRSFFHYLRLAMFFFPRNKPLRLASVLLDTFGSIANYTPPKIPDPSLRIIDRNKIYEPFVRLPQQQEVNHELPLKSDDVKHSIIHTGRYLWKTYESDMASLLGVAKHKLLSYSDATPRPEQLVAICGCRLALYFHASERLSMDLVRSHGASLYCVSADRERMWIGYPSEPALTAAASNATEQLKWDTLIDYLTDACRTGLVEAGVRGELVARILLLMAMDACRSGVDDPIRHAMPLNVSSFLNNLFGADNVFKVVTGSGQWSEEDAVDFMDGSVNFNHFLYVDYTPTNVDLKRYFKNNAAIFCRRNQPIIDLIIPVYLGGAEESFTSILVQVKMHEKGTGLKDLPADIELKTGMRKTHEERKPTLYLFMQLGQRRANRLCALEQNDKGCLFVKSLSARGLHRRSRVLAVKQSTSDSPATVKTCLIGAFGISTTVYPFLDDTICNRLIALGRAWADPVGLLESPPKGLFHSENEEHAKMLRTLLKLQYPLKLMEPATSVDAPPLYDVDDDAEDEQQVDMEIDMASGSDGKSYTKRAKDVVGSVQEGGSTSSPKRRKQSTKQ